MIAKNNVIENAVILTGRAQVTEEGGGSDKAATAHSCCCCCLPLSVNSILSTPSSAGGTP